MPFTVLLGACLVGNGLAAANGAANLLQEGHEVANVNLLNVQGKEVNALYVSQKQSKVPVGHSSSRLKTKDVRLSSKTKESMEEAGALMQVHISADRFPSSESVRETDQDLANVPHFLRSQGCLMMQQACVPVDAEPVELQKWFSDSSAVISCCNTVPEYAAMDNLCSSVFGAAFHNLDTLCNTVGDLYRSHLDHVRVEPILLQFDQGYHKEWNSIVLDELTWHLEPIYKPLKVTHSVLVAHTPSGPYRLEQGRGYDVLIIKGGHSNGTVLASVDLPALKEGATLLSLIQGFPGGGKMWNWGTNNCHHGAEMAFSQVSTVPVPMVPHRFWQEKLGKVLPQKVQDMVLAP